MSREELLSTAQVINELRVPRSTFYRWRATNRGPHSIRLPNGQIRIRRRDLNNWINRQEEQNK